ncbi:MAG: hypothetical protein QM648_07715 [Solirubrobacterales bacterium]
MSSSRFHKTHFSLLALLLAAALLTGCGNSADKGDSSAQGEVKDLSGALDQTSSTGPVEAAPQTDGTEAEPDQSGTESTDFVPVDVSLRGGGFGGSTPKVTHVPADFLIIVSAKADDAGPYSLSVISPKTAQTFKIASGKSMKITLDSLRAGQTARLVVGDQTRKITADAEPGP